MATDSKVITLALSPAFATFLDSVHQQHNIPDLARSNAINLPSIALDPGETTGVAEFDGDTRIVVYQQETKEIGPSYEWLRERLDSGFLDPPDFTLGRESSWHSFNHLRYEDYRVYEWKASDHAWSPVHTIRWIGAIEVAIYKSGINASCCMAQHAKGFWTDAKLDHFGINPKGLKHGRDALRHLLYYMCFPTKAA